MAEAGKPYIPQAPKLSELPDPWKDLKLPTKAPGTPIHQAPNLPPDPWNPTTLDEVAKGHTPSALKLPDAPTFPDIKTTPQAPRLSEMPNPFPDASTIPPQVSSEEFKRQTSAEGHKFTIPVRTEPTVGTLFINRGQNLGTIIKIHRPKPETPNYIIITTNLGTIYSYIEESK